MMESPGIRSEIAFFDVETTIRTRPGQRYAILEFGAILICPRKLVELESYSTLVRPSDLSLISAGFVRKGITLEAVSSAPSFGEIADEVYDLLHGRIWAGHNILKFDCARIEEAFEDIGRPPPEPKGMIDSLALLTEKFGRRAGDMKMATLATYFGLGQQTHRSLNDVRMNLEVLKCCATVLFLESSIPDIVTANSWASPNAQTRSHGIGMVLPVDKNLTSTSRPQFENYTMSSPTDQILGKQILNFVEPNSSEAEYSNMSRFTDQIHRDSVQEDILMEEKSVPVSPEISLPAVPEGCRSSSFLAIDDVSITSIDASLIPLYHGVRKIQILHKSVTLKLHCEHLKVQFTISTKFANHAGWPRLSFVVDAPPNLCQVLGECDYHVRSLLWRCGSTLDWRPAVTIYRNIPTIRLHIPTLVTGDTAKYATEIYHKEAATGTEKKLLFSRCDPADLDGLFTVGTFIDAFFSLDSYDYQPNAGIRLVAEKLVIWPK
ncbi:hypothetical protein Ancab_038835 [Ancistrocladus abbreviatus]